MIKVECRVDPYRIGGKDTAVDEPRKLIFESCGQGNQFVTFYILDPDGNSKVMDVLGDDVINAVSNCMRRGR